MEKANSVLSSPWTLEPLAVPRVWGGDAISRRFRRAAPGPDPIGESWEVAGCLSASNGFRTAQLDDLVRELGPRLLGTHLPGVQRFPLLTKWLDCQQWLSVQVHPDDTLAREFTGDPHAHGKTEAWFVLGAAEHAQVCHGFKTETLAPNYATLPAEELLELLDRRSVRSGDLLFTPAGTIHALGPGSLIYEVQQDCDLTYRLFDWGRPRSLHPQQAWRCLLEAVPVPGRVRPAAGASGALLDCPYFRIQTIHRDGCFEVDHRSFQLLVASDRGGVIKGSFGELKMSPGQTVLLPAGTGEVGLETTAGADRPDTPFLRIDVPEPLR